MTKTIFILTIVAAFITGSITTGTLAFAAPGDKGQPFEALQAAIADLQDQITNIQLIEGPQGPPGTTDFNGLTNVPPGFSDGIDNVNDADNDPTNELQSLSTRAISGGFSGINPGVSKDFSLQCLTGEVLTGVDSFFRGTAQAGFTIPIQDSNGNVVGINLQVVNPVSGELNGEGVMRIICSKLVTTP